MARNDALEKMNRLLDQERSLLLKGDIAGLDPIAREKARLAPELGVTVTDEQNLQELRHKAMRNDQLLNAALKGVRAARTRLQEIRNGGAPMTTYGTDGQRHAIGPTSTISRRA